MIHKPQITNKVKANILENICKRFEVIRKYILENNAHTFIRYVTHLYISVYHFPLFYLITCPQAEAPQKLKIARQWLT
jgi:hypothetical protein